MLLVPAPYSGRLVYNIPYLITAGTLKAVSNLVFEKSLSFSFFIKASCLPSHSQGLVMAAQPLSEHSPASSCISPFLVFAEFLSHTMSCLRLHSQ